MKKTIALLLALVMLLALTACKTDLADSTTTDKPAETATTAPETTTDSDSTSEDTSSGSKDVVKIRFAAKEDPAGSNAEAAYFIEKVNEFNAADNGIEVEMIFIASEADYLNRLATDVASGDCPNIFVEYGGSRVLDYLKAGMLLDFTEYYEADPDWYNSVYPTMWTPCVFDSYGFDGIYGIPFAAYEVVLVYNQKYLDQCGLEVPTTWDELMHSCEVLKENGIQPFKVGEGDNYRFGHLFSNLAITKYGPEIAEKIGSREIGYDSDEAKAIYELMIDAYSKGYLGENVLAGTGSEERAFMGAGDMAFTYDLTTRIYWMDGTDEMNAGNLHVTTFPAVSEEYKGWCQGGASQAMYISTQNASQEQIDASMTFLKYITGSEFMAGLVNATNSPYAIAAESTNKDRCYIYDEIDEVITQIVGTVPELQNFDSEASGVTIVRNALSTIVQGATADDIAKTITDGYADIE